MRETIPLKPHYEPVKFGEKIYIQEIISIMTARYNDRLMHGHYSAVIMIEPTRKLIIAGFTKDK